MKPGGKRATLCEICGEAVSHKDGIVVGRRLSGIPRLICGARKCVREWQARGAEIAREWVENRPDAPRPFWKPKPPGEE